MTPKPKPASGATLKDVAELAGVSSAAASKILHGGGASIRVSEARAQAIREAAESLRYRPNHLARSLRTSRTQTVGLVWDRITRIADGPQYYIHLLDGLSAVFFQNHYRLTILPEIPEVNPLPTICDGRVDGVVWCKMPRDPELALEISRSPVHVVAMNAATPTVPDAYPNIGCDNHGGAALVVDHLVALGHRRILLALDHGWDTAPDAIARRDGFREAMLRHGLPCGPEDEVVWNVASPELAAWRDARPPHTAIFAWHEGLAGAILAACAASGLRVPQDLSVVGFDSTMYCEMTTPRLTAVRQPIREMAECAAHTLLDLMEGRPISRSRPVFPCTLDVRDSTAPPAGAHPTLIAEVALS